MSPERFLENTRRAMVIVCMERGLV